MKNETYLIIGILKKTFINDDGKVTYWHENGQIKSEGIFKDGVCIRGSC